MEGFLILDALQVAFCPSLSADCIAIYQKEIAEAIGYESEYRLLLVFLES